jgi:RNA polymerase sigma-70 factor (ECF subfamily)
MDMENPLDSRTRQTLLRRLAGSGSLDQGSWAEFVEHYGRRIYGWCLRWKLQEADAEDVTQTVLLKLAGRMKDFAYDPSQSFRAWLKTVTHHAWRDYVDGRGRAGRGTGGDGLAALETVAAREDLEHALEEQFDRELLDRAMQTVQLRTAPHNWQAFHLTAFEGVSVVEAARRLDMKVARVYAARSTIQQLLREEVARLEAES